MTRFILCATGLICASGCIALAPVNLEVSMIMLVLSMFFLHGGWRGN